MSGNSPKNLKNSPFRIAILIFVAIVLISPVTTYAARNFLRVLKIGDQGQDVLFVQKVLNLSTSTQIAATGPGSPGNETIVFGRGTQNAINRFQTLYAKDILIPAGLAQPTGMAGFLTLKKINAVSDAYTSLNHTTINMMPQNSWGAATTTLHISSTGSTSTATSAKTVVVPTPIITSVTPSVIISGNSVSISGQNFDPSNNTVIVSIDDPKKFTGIASPDTKNLSTQLNIALVSFLAKGIARLSDADRDRAIAMLIQKGTFVAGPGDGSAYINATIQIDNKNGRSQPFPVLIRSITK